MSWLSPPQTRLIGPWGQANLTALILAIGMISSFRILVEVNVTRGCRIIVWGSLVFATYAGYLTLSRSWLVFVGVWLAVSATFAVLELKQRSKRQYELKRFAPVFVVVIVLFFVSGPIDKTLNNVLLNTQISAEDSGLLVRTDVSSFKVRLDEWEKAITHLSATDSLIFGHGPGRYGSFSYIIEQSPSFSGTSSERLWSHAHNLFIQVIVEFGVLGFLLVLVGVGILLRRLWLLPRNPNNLALSIIILIILAHNLVEFSLWYFPFFALFLVFLSLVFRDISTSSEPSSRLTKFLVAAVIVVILPIGGRAIMDYFYLTLAFNRDVLTQQDQHNLNMIKNSPLFRAEAYKVDILKIKPVVLGAEGNLKVLSEIKRIRPEPIIVMRHTVLSSLFDDDGVICGKIVKTVRTYPFLLPHLKSELTYLRKNGGDMSLPTLIICADLGLSQRS
jgi:O-antigen ligase